MSVELHFLCVPMRMPLKFGTEVCTDVTCVRVAFQVSDQLGRSAIGWGESTLAVQWSWPSSLPFADRERIMKQLCERLAKAWANFDSVGHPLEIGQAFLQTRLDNILDSVNTESTLSEPVPHLAALICNAAFDFALYDAFGNLHEIPVFQSLDETYLTRDLYSIMGDAPDTQQLRGLRPADFLNSSPPEQLPVWHLVGGLDPLTSKDLQGNEPQDCYPTTLEDWITRDGLKCLKIKLRGNEADWDYHRIVDVGQLASVMGVDWLSTDFNCTVHDPAYVNELLDRLVLEHPRIYGMVLYVEQPFPYDLEAHQIDVHSVSARKPLFLDESAHDWQHVRMGRSLGWSGVALKTCKTLTGALLSMCWAKSHGMTLMVQDATNPMLAIVPHVLLAANAGTIMGVECNAAQYYPAASSLEERIHPGLYRRHQGVVDFSTVHGSGFGYRLGEIGRHLPSPAASFSRQE